MGIGFQPKAVILYTAGVASANSAGLSTDGFTFATGFTDTALNKRATVMACKDNIGTSQTRRRAVLKERKRFHLFQNQQLNNFFLSLLSHTISPMRARMPDNGREVHGVHGFFFGASMM